MYYYLYVICLCGHAIEGQVYVYMGTCYYCCIKLN